MQDQSKEKPQCQNCKWHSCGTAVVLQSGTQWNWQECQKGWGKPEPIGVLKNVCPLWIKKV